MPENYLLFERLKKIFLRFPKEICGIFFRKKDTSDFLEKSEKSFFRKKRPQIFLGNSRNIFSKQIYLGFPWEIRGIFFGPSK